MPSGDSLIVEAILWRRFGGRYRPATEAEVLAAAGAITSARRKTRGGGAPKKLSKCKGCGLRLGVREKRLHKCEGKP